MPETRFELDGAPGSYISTPDLNLLDADTAHLQQSVGLWTGGTLSTEQAMFGDSSMKVLGGALVSFTATSDGANMGVHIYSAVGGTFTVNGSSTVVPAGVWTHCPAAAGNQGTYQVTMAGGDDYYVDACYISDTLTSFLPSLRIVGDWDYGARITDDIQAANAFLTVFDRTGTSAAGQRVYRQAGASTISTPFNTAGGLVNVASNAVWDGDGEVHDFRCTRVASSGVIAHYRDGVAAGGGTYAAGALIPGTRDFDISGRYDGGVDPWTGSVERVDLNDGIDGPAVAVLDPNDLVVVQ